jgi:hypothetical protein
MATIVATAEIVFASPLQESDPLTPDTVEAAVTATELRLGLDGCIAQLAGEYARHPDTAAARMRFSLRAAALICNCH